MLTETRAKPEMNFNAISVRRHASVMQNNVWQALHRLAEMNEVVRSGFAQTDDESMPFVQVVWDSLEQHGLSLHHPLQLKSRQNSDLSLIYLHHALYDGPSWDLILDDLNSILAGDHPLPGPAFQHFAEYQTQVRAEKQARASEYWRGLQLESACRLLPQSCASFTTERRSAIRKTLGVPYNDLAALARRIHVSPQAALQVCWARLLGTTVVTVRRFKRGCVWERYFGKTRHSSECR